MYSMESKTTERRKIGYSKCTSEILILTFYGAKTYEMFKQCSDTSYWFIHNRTELVTAVKEFWITGSMVCLQCEKHEIKTMKFN